MLMLQKNTTIQQIKYFGSLGYKRLQVHSIGNVPSEKASQVA